MQASDPHRALGAFLRAHRERLPPPTLGPRRRRTPGWRREEVAEACGVSLTWITWLEQGREVAASAATLARLAEGLRLSAAERAYLFALAARRDPAAPVSADSTLPPEIGALPQRIALPAYLLDRTWNAVAWNAPAQALFTGWLDGANDRNLLRFVFLQLSARELLADWEERARRLVAEFRADFSRCLRDPDMKSLIEDLCERSPLFRQRWQEHSVLEREGGERAFRGPPRRYHQTTMTFPAYPDLKLVTLSPLAPP